MDLQKVEAALENVLDDDRRSSGRPSRRTIDMVVEAIAELEKPADDNYMVLLDAVFNAIKENGIMNHPRRGMFLTGESINACLPIIQQYAESFAAKDRARVRLETLEEVRKLFFETKVHKYTMYLGRLIDAAKKEAGE